MGDLSAHFSRGEFTCKCGCGKDSISPELIKKLELIYAYCAALPTGCKYIIVTSGCRCSAHSVAVGGYKNDAHTVGIASDIQVYKADGSRYAPIDIAAIAEHVGCTGIGVMQDATHVDIRNKTNYTNSHWFGNEVTGNTYETFAQYLPQAVSKHTLQIKYDGKVIFETTF